MHLRYAKFKWLLVLHSAPPAECPCCLPLFVPLTNLIALLVATATNQIIEKIVYWASVIPWLSAAFHSEFSIQRCCTTIAKVLLAPIYHLPLPIFHYTTVSHTVSAQFIPVGMILPSNQIPLKLRWCLAASEITTNISENFTGNWVFGPSTQ